MRTQKALGSALLVSGLILSACGGSAAPTAPAAVPTSPPAAATAAPKAADATKVPEATKAPAATTAAPAAATAAPAAGGASKGKLKIVSSLPMTGSSLGQTQTLVNAMKMRLDEAGNKAGGFDIVYDALDDATAAAGKWDPDQETANAKKAVADADVMVYIGTFNSGAAKLSIPILNEANLVMISPANTYVGLTKKFDAGEPDKYYPTGKRNYTRVAPADSFQGPVDARWAKSLGAAKIYILDDQEVYGKGLADLFEAEAKKIGLNVLGREGIDGKAADYKALMTKIKGLNPDLVYYGGITQNNAGQLVKDMKSVGLAAKFLGPDGIQEDAFIDATGKDVAEGVYATSPGIQEKDLPQKGQDFYKNYRAKFKSEPESYAKYAYDAMSIALNAIEKAGKKDRGAIRDAVFATKDFDGVLGRYSFDADGDTSLTAYLGFVVKGGKWELVSPLQ